MDSPTKVEKPGKNDADVVDQAIGLVVAALRNLEDDQRFRVLTAASVLLGVKQR